MITSFVDRDDLTTALERSTTLYAAMPKVVAALERACEKLCDATWTYDTRTDVLRISSATTPHSHYEVDFLSCTCVGARRGRYCWHTYARDLLQFAIQIGYERAMPAGGLLDADDATYRACLGTEAPAW